MFHSICQLCINERKINRENHMKTKITLLFLMLICSQTLVFSNEKEDHLIGKWNAQMLIGNSSNYDRGVGFGVRGNFEFSTKTFSGVTIIYHMGFPRSVSVNGRGPAVFWGPEIGQRFDLTYFKIECVCSAGQLTYEEAPEYTPHYAQGTVSKFYYSPGLGITTRTETGSAGIHVRYVVVDHYNMFGVYFSVGI